jgi:hypothetical protein
VPCRPAKHIPALFNLAALALMGGCAGPGLSEGFDAPDPGARLHAIKDAARSNDRTAIPRLVSLLDSDDPVVRMLSIRALEQMTGQTLDYDYAATMLERKSGIGRWNAWLVGEGFVPAEGAADADAPLASRHDRLPTSPSPSTPRPPRPPSTE